MPWSLASAFDEATFIRDPLLFALSEPAPALASTPVRPSEALAVTLTGPPDQVAWTPSNASGLHEIFTEPIPNVQSGVVNDASYVPALSNASMSRAIASARDSGAGASLHGGGVRLVAALDMNDAGAVVDIRVAGHPRRGVADEPRGLRTIVAPVREQRLRPNREHELGIHVARAHQESGRFS